ncbi:hypothetical protein LY76DRAFT_516294 [Colletotrichum caudatum]|nr:hypothetical protein LY76DRAFT_516294 [Colletotrichum caudatum]
MTGPTEEKPRYRYRGLDRGSREIRVVELLPGTPDETIRIKFHHVALAPRRQSAARLPPTRDEIQRTLPADWIVRVCLDGRFIFERVREYGPEEPYETSWLHPVTGVDPNLRYLDMPRRMWVDALCINQADLAERNEQVYMMCDIYRRASHVVVWLGAGGGDSALAVAALRHLGEQAIYTERGAWRTNPPGCSNPELARASVALPYDGRTWAAVARLLRRPWFERLWVWQEVRLADERSFMLCGPDSISLSLFRRAIFCASDKKALPGAEVRGLILDAVEVMLPFSNQPFFRELQTLSWKGCADPRDKIYGALGAAPAAIREDVRPDYSLPVEEVYARFCRVYLARIGRLDFLDRCDIDAREIRGPSWVPDWSVPVDRAVRLPYADVFYAAGASAAEVVLRPGSSSPSSSSSAAAAGTGDEIMEAAGVRCGTVSFVGRKAPPDSEGLLAAVRAWEPTALSTERYAPTGERSVDAFVTLLGLGYTIERWPQCNSLLSVPEAAGLYGREFAGGVGVGGAAAAPSHESLNFVRVRHRYFFKTDSGHMGTCHARPRVGDGLVVLLGCPSPLLVREEEDVSGPGSGSGGGRPPRRFRVVGATYTHGLMDTEALLGALPDGWRARMSREAGFFDSMHFFSAETDTVTKEDPRLGDDPAEWERMEAVRTGDDPWNFARYRNRRTREVINSDPRLAAGALEARGVKVDKFCLV